MPDVSGTRLAPLEAVLRKCLADETLARRIDAAQLDAFAVPAVVIPNHAASGYGIKSVEREYRELRELIGNTQFEVFRSCQKHSARLGTAFHEVMERVDLRDFVGLSELLREAGTRNNLNDAGRQKLGDMIEKCLASDLMRRVSTAVREGRRVLRETPFIRPLDGGGVQEGRIDLLFEDKDAWTLVDYKTGRIPQSAEDTEAYFRNKYADQIRAYRDALESMSIKTGDVFLLLARTGGVIEMPVVQGCIQTYIPNPPGNGFNRALP